MPKRSLPRASFTTLALSVVLAGTLLPFTGSFANGSSTEIFRGRKGPYELIVGVRPEVPVVGVVHFSLTPLNAGNSELIPRAEIVILARHSQEDLLYKAPALNAPFERRFYEANMTMESPGDWMLTVAVTTDEFGQETFAVPLRVGGLPIVEPTQSAAWILPLLLFAFAAGVGYLWYSSRRAL